MLEKLKDFFIRNEIGEPPWEYAFLVNLNEKEYPKYLAKIFKYRTGENLHLKYDFKNMAWVIDKKRCKTFNQKLQWIKLYGVTDLMRQCTDKVAVRDYVKEKIGEEYLKPVLQIIPAPIVTCSHSEHSDNLGAKRKICRGRCRGRLVMNKTSKAKDPFIANFSRENLNQLSDNTDVSTYFDQIQWDKLPNSFVIKCNHGCKWQYIIKDKEQFLNTAQLFEIVKRNMTGWLNQEFWGWAGFEMQYKTYTPRPNPPHPGRENVYSHSIVPKILIEPLLRDEINTPCKEIHVYCFSGMPKLIIKLHKDNEVTLWDENLNCIDDILSTDDIKIYEKADNLINQIFDLSIILAKNFQFVRVDWMIYKNKPYFEELTFTPYSGFNKINKKLNSRLSR